MNRFEELITAIQARPSVVIHVGAGTCKEYAFYKSLEPNRYIFVEPDQKLAEKARNRFKNANNVSIIASAIAPRNGIRKLKITNNRRFSSLLSPGQLLDFYPNIQVIDEVETEAIRLEQLCLNESIVRETDNLLVVELQGLEKDIFPILAEKTLYKFKWIAIRSSQQTLYQRTSTSKQKALPQAMRDAGYTVLVLKEDVPPFINILCIRNDAALERLNTISTLNNSLSKQKSDLRKVSRQLTQRLEQAQTQNAALATENSDQLKQIKELGKVAQDKIVGLEKSRTQIARLATENSQQMNIIKGLEELAQDSVAALEKSRIQNANLATENNEHINIIKELQEFAQDKLSESEKPQTQISTLATENREQMNIIKELEKVAAGKTIELEKLQTQISRLTTENNARLQQIKELGKAVVGKTTELEKSQAQISTLTTENSAQLQQIQELEKAAAGKTTKLEKSQTQISTLTNKHNLHLQQIKELEMAAAAKTTELEKLQTQISTLTTENSVQQQLITELAQSAEENSEEMAEIQKDLRIKNKIILKSDTDLRDLQSQYRSALQHQDQQHALLCELKEKLELAAEFYKQLNLQDQILEGDTLEKKTAQTIDSPKTDSNSD